MTESQQPARRRWIASKYSSKLRLSWPPSASPNSLYYSLQTSSITASKCISKLARLRPPSAYLQTRLITASKCISKLARSRPPNISPHSLNCGLQVHLQTRSITSPKCISKFAQLQPPCSSTNSLDHDLRVHL